MRLLTYKKIFTTAFGRGIDDHTLHVHVALLLTDLASFPDSTPQLFIHSAIKRWGVESGNEATQILIVNPQLYNPYLLHAILRAA